MTPLTVAVASFGATGGRKADGDVKSSCRLLCPPARRHEFAGWDTRYVHDTVNVLSPDDATAALGVPFGSLSLINDEAKHCADVCSQIRLNILDINDAPTEVVLTRQCADVSKMMYHLRVNGDRICDDTLASFDQNLRVSFESILGGDLTDTSWWRATSGVKFGGLRLRTARSTAASAFVASRIASRPLVKTMVEHFCSATGSDSSDIMLAYDRRTEDALVTVVGELPPDSSVELLDKLKDCSGGCAALA